MREPWFGSERDAVSTIQTNTHGQGVSAGVCRVWLASEKESSQRETETDNDERKKKKGVNREWCMCGCVGLWTVVVVARGKATKRVRLRLNGGLDGEMEDARVVAQLAIGLGEWISAETRKEKGKE